ncbi:Uncharacterised protein [Serratia fonticola]|uniref:Uncharacterized protein n=1 Tax=Serratia fonticola TaxID=47917 RepID=A0A3S5B1M4_SERFO|nr:Uncharacterised protein [Serratia fonticola]
MKTVISTVLIFTALLIGLWYYSLHQVRKPFRCDTQQIFVQVKGQKSIVLNANATVIFSSSKNGIVYISGSIKEGDTRYLLDRKIFFTITPSEIKGLTIHNSLMKKFTQAITHRNKSGVIFYCQKLSVLIFIVK